MKLVRIGAWGEEKPALLDDRGQYRDLSGVIDDIAGNALDPENLAKLAKLDVESLAIVDNPGRIGSCVGDSGKFIGIGLNYSDHAEETGQPVPSEPVVFMKATSAICGPNDDVVLPPDSRKTDWEVELGVVIGRTARHVRPEEALSHVAGYCVVHDLSERAFQIEHGGQWVKGKSYDRFGSVGPWLVTPDEVGDPQNIDLWLKVNGTLYQNGNTGNMIFPVAELVAYLSRFMTLHPGDIITTGTPAGVGMGQKPAVFLHPGDVVTLGASGLGEQRQRFHSYDEKPAL